MNTSDTTQKLQRVYRVRLRPTAPPSAFQKALADVMPEDTGIADDGWYDERQVTLWWNLDEAPDAGSRKEFCEIERRAIKLERAEFDTPADTRFEVEVLGMVKTALVTPKPRRKDRKPTTVQHIPNQRVTA